VHQGIYLVNIGWNESAIGIAFLSMGLTSLIVQTYAGDIIDKTSIDRRLILGLAALLTSCSVMAIFFVHDNGANTDHAMMYITKIIEGMASSFINPCLAALTLASFGPDQFDTIMASNTLWSHIGSSLSAILAGTAAYVFYPQIKFCFFVISFSGLLALFFIQCLPEGDPLMGRGFASSNKSLQDDDEDSNDHVLEADELKHNIILYTKSKDGIDTNNPIAFSYIEVMSEPKTLILCLTGFFFHFANANVLLVLGELMTLNENNNDDDQGGISQSVIPLTAGAILLAQATMSIATIIADKFTKRGIGRKPLFIAALITLPLRCALLVYWKDAGNTYLLSTQILDGLGFGFISLIHPYLIADITFGTGRFNLIMGMTASCFGLGATLSNFLGQMVVEKLGHVASLSGSLILSFIPIVVFVLFMPETYHTRGIDRKAAHDGDMNTSMPNPLEMTVNADYVLA